MRVSAMPLGATGERRQQRWDQLASIDYQRDGGHHRIGSTEQ
jgi:hypothetical protein